MTRCRRCVRSALQTYCSRRGSPNAFPARAANLRADNPEKQHPESIKNPLRVQTFDLFTSLCVTDVPVRLVSVALHLFPSDDIPDAGHPVSEQSEHGHEECEHHGTVLRVTIQLLKQTQESQQTYRLQQVNQRCLTNTHTHTHVRPRENLSLT